MFTRSDEIRPDDQYYWVTENQDGSFSAVPKQLEDREEVDQDGNPITTNFADYTFISAVELPSIEVVHMETPTFINPLGAKGIGESGSIGSTPAVQSAVIDALLHLGVRHIDMPTTPERVWSAIANASA
jgi:carbon-monoxide dehydrogenase large subunit